MSYFELQTLFVAFLFSALGWVVLQVRARMWIGLILGASSMCLAILVSHYASLKVPQDKLDRYRDVLQLSADLIESGKSDAVATAFRSHYAEGWRDPVKLIGALEESSQGAIAPHNKPMQPDEP